MFKNYLIVALRNMMKQKMYSFINISGLTIGMACTILIMLWVKDEMSFDRFHENADHIYRVVFADESYEQIRHYWVTPPALAAALKKDFPEVRHSVKFHSQDGMLVTYGESKFKETAGFTDASVFDIFTLPFINGNPRTALVNPYSAVITEKMAVKYFGHEDPMNKRLTLDNQIDVTVTGVIQDIPDNSYLQFDFLIQFEHLHELTGQGNVESWNNYGYSTFVLLPEDVNINEFNQKIADLALKAESYDDNFKPRLYLQPLVDIHLYNLNGGGAITYVYIFSLIAVFVLLIACINFMNLATARSATRSKEVGLRKVIGGSKLNLIQQFYGESILLSFIALIFSLILVELSLPAFNYLSGKALSLNFMGNFQMLPVLFGVALVTGIISGSYPALFLSSFKPVNVLKGSKISGSSLLRKILVVFQFSLSIVLIICTLVVSNQLDYINSQYLGFDKDQVLYIPLNHELKAKSALVKNELLQNPQILNVSATSSKIGIRPLWSVDLNQWEGNDREKALLLSIIHTDYDFLETFNIEMASGRYYSREFATDTGAVVLNETAIKEMGLKDPIGKRIFEKTHIIGVVKDFNFKSLHSNIAPLALFMNPNRVLHMAVKIKADDINSTISYLKDMTKKFAPDFPFEYHFLDEDFEQLYRSERRLETIFNYFSTLAIIISCLGLFGLASFTAGQRTKEIGIRKVLGASVSGIVVLLSKEFTKWVLLANIFAWPVAYYAMKNWLQNFAYRIDLSWEFFILTGWLALMIAILIVSFLAIKAAITNPVETLRYE
ncbi:MAG: ABC transporter permease [bacterium]|nr:MAG: ABC transporter permease [bacterium]